MRTGTGSSIKFFRSLFASVVVVVVVVGSKVFQIFAISS